MGNIIVKDAIMGSGKTYDAIKYINDNSDRKFVFVTPFLKEVERIIESVDTSRFHEPSNGNIDGSKVSGLKWLVENNHNVATTHALFHKLKRNDYSIFSEYDLILDEVTTPVELESISKDDTDLLFRDGIITVDKESRLVSWINTEYKSGRFQDFREKVETNNVLYIEDMFFIWAFPIELFTSFKSITILTYLFNGSILKYYFDYNNIEYDIEYKDDVIIRREIAKLLDIYDGESNSIGSRRTAFSVGWLKKKTLKDLDKISNRIKSVALRHYKTKSNYIGFTTFKEFESDLLSDGYKKSFIPVNSRATNEYDYKETMIYCANRFLNPNLVKFFKSQGITIDQEMYALGELIQWIWRGRIRKNEPMNLYIPSKRMRDILIEWLNK